MEPDREWKSRATLVDLLDRVFDKGVVIQADLIISVAGIPLIGVNLRAALAGMETMLKYGLLQDMDAKTRMWEAQHRKNEQVPLIEAEEVALKMFGSYYYSKGIYRAWKSGYLYLTNFRLLLYQQDMAEVVFQTPLEKMTAIKIRREKSFTGKNKDIIYLALEGGKIVRLNALQTQEFIEKLRELQEKIGVSLGELPAEELDETTNKFLMDGERICYQGRMWHLMPNSGVMPETWKPGYLYLTNKRLCWWYEFEGKILFQVPIDKITGAIQERRNLSAVLTDKKVLDVIYYSNNGSKIVASFSGKETEQWQKALIKMIAKEGSQIEDKEIETCPQCGKKALVKELLEQGCKSCGWVSPRLKKPKLLKKLLPMAKI